MSDFLSDFIGNLGGDVSSKMGSNLGVDSSVIEKIIPAVAPMILGGLKKQSETQGGQDRVDHILNKYGDQNVLGNLDELFSKKSSDPNPDPTLGGLLGNSGTQATDLISKAFNLDGSTAAKFITMLAPVILGFITNKRDTQGEGSTGIAALLDRDGDGSVLDDVGGLLMDTLGKSDSGLGDILDGLLGGKK